MPSLKPAFDAVAPVPNLIWLLWAIAILEDDEQRDRDARRKNDRHRKIEMLRRWTAPRPF